MLSLWLEIIAFFLEGIVNETALIAQKLHTMIEGCYRVPLLMFKSVCDKGISL